MQVLISLLIYQPFQRKTEAMKIVFLGFMVCLWGGGSGSCCLLWGTWPSLVDYREGGRDIQHKEEGQRETSLLRLLLTSTVECLLLSPIV